MSWRNRQDIWSVHPHLSHVMKCGQRWFRQHRERRRQQRQRWPQARQFTAPAKTLPGQRNNARTRVQCTAAAAAAAELTNLTVMKSLRRCKWKHGDTALGGIHTTCLPWTSLSFRNHRMLAAGLLPEVVHVRVITSLSMAGLVNPVISGRPGTPAWCQSKNREDTRRGGRAE